MLNRTGLVAPYSGNAGDGNASDCELSTAEEIREQIEAPIRKARASALKDAVTYLTDNAVNGANHDVRAALNIRWNLAWTVVDEIIREARPLAEIAIRKAKSEREKSQDERTRFDNLAGLFTALGLQIQINHDQYTLLGLTELQLRLIADVLTETV